MSTNQTGHEQNVVNLGVLITRVGTFSEAYNPSRNELAISSLTQLKTNGETAIASVTSAENGFRNSTSARSSAFDVLDSLIARVINSLRTSGASTKTIEQAEAIVRNRWDKRATSKLINSKIAAASEKGTDTNPIAQHSNNIDSKIENFNKLIRFLSLIEEYKPIETDLVISALDTKLAVLNETKAGLIAADAALDAARWQRNTILYKENTGLMDIALAMKSYVKAAYGATSSQYKEVSNIVFSKSR